MLDNNERYISSYKNYTTQTITIISSLKISPIYPTGLIGLIGLIRARADPRDPFQRDDCFFPVVVSGAEPPGQAAHAADDRHGVVGRTDVAPR